MDTVEAIIGQAVRLALASGLGWPAAVLVVVVLAVVLVLAKRLRLPAYTPDPPPPDATWGDNVKPNDGPPGGGMEGG